MSVQVRIGILRRHFFTVDSRTPLHANAQLRRFLVFHIKHVHIISVSPKTKTALKIQYKINANLICFLASDDASYIVGQNIQIDGCRKKI